jgi:PAS domain S-box-containing protein
MRSAIEQDQHVNSSAYISELEVKVKELEEQCASNQIYQHFFNESKDLACIANLEGYFTYVNPSFTQILGYSKKELLTEPYITLVHPEDAGKTFMDIDLIHFSKNPTIKFENRYFTKSGKIVYLEWMSTIDEHANKVYAIGRDITIKKEIEERLQRSERLLNEAQRISKTGSWSFDFSTNQLFWSDEMYAIYQISTSIKGIDLNDAFVEQLTPQEREHWHKLVQNAITRGETYSLERFIEFADGTSKWIKETGRSVKDEHDRVFKIEGIAQDITEQKSAQEVILNNVREKEILIKELHHRVKNNLQVISSLLNLQAALFDDTRLKSAIFDSQQRIKSMATVHDLLYRSSNLSLIDFSEYVQNLIHEIVNSYKSPDQHITINIEIEHLHYSIDQAVPLGLFVNEIVTNSLKHGFKDRNEGHVSCSMHALKNGKQRMEISDNGNGMATKNKTKDKSLGLMLIDNLAEQLDGTLVKSTSKNGTQYALTF